MSTATISAQELVCNEIFTCHIIYRDVFCSWCNFKMTSTFPIVYWFNKYAMVVKLWSGECRFIPQPGQTFSLYVLMSLGPYVLMSFCPCISPYHPLPLSDAIRKLPRDWFAVVFFGFRDRRPSSGTSVWSRTQRGKFRRQSRQENRLRNPTNW